MSIIENIYIRILEKFFFIENYTYFALKCRLHYKHLSQGQNWINIFLLQLNINCRLQMNCDLRIFCLNAWNLRCVLHWLMNYDSLSITSNFPWTVMWYFFAKYIWCIKHFLLSRKVMSSCVSDAPNKCTINFKSCYDANSCMPLRSCYSPFFIWHDNHGGVKFLFFYIE